jgi:mono/diheme cytochrome c family protein
MRCWVVGVAVALAAGTAGTGAAERAREKTPAERGREALLGKSFSPPIITWRDYGNLWKVWGLKEKPADFDRRLRARYGLHEAPYPNKGLPMGLREASYLLGKGPGVDCMLCHSASLFGKPVMGLGNTSLDLQALFDEVAQAQGFKQLTPYALSHVRGTSEASAAAVYLYQFRDPDLTVRREVKMALPENTCEDVPAWWLLKKKKTMYATGPASARAVRPLMSFMLTPLYSGGYIKSHEPTFRDIQQYLLSLEAPKYPFPVDPKKAAAGKELFEQTCARCHGTYGPGGTYPNKVVDVDVVGTDPTLATTYSAHVERWYNESWFGQEKGPDGKPLPVSHNRGYQAPPLDGVWATAPYFHNGSVPTVYHVLNSRARPKLFTRSYRTGKDDYDPARLGWKVTPLDRAPGAKAPGIERRKVYDTSQPGRSNRGHPFGDKLTEDQRMAVIEYLKTL